MARRWGELVPGTDRNTRRWNVLGGGMESWDWHGYQMETMFWQGHINSWGWHRYKTKDIPWQGPKSLSFRQMFFMFYSAEIFVQKRPNHFISRQTYNSLEVCRNRQKKRFFEILFPLPKQALNLVYFTTNVFYFLLCRYFCLKKTKPFHLTTNL